MSAMTPAKARTLATLITLLVMWILLSASTHIVPAGNRGVVFSSASGLKQVNLTEGFHLITPIFDRVTDYEVRTRTYAFSDTELDAPDRQAPVINAKTSDAQTVYLDLTLRYHLDPEQVWQIHGDIGPTWEEKIVRVKTEATSRDVVAAYKAEELFSTKRQEVQDRITTDLATIFAERWIVLDEALIRNIAFTPEYQQKIEQKQIALQRAQQKDYELQREQKEKIRKTIEAKAEAEAIRIKGESLARYPSVIRYDLVSKMPDDVETYVITGDTIVNMSDLFAKKPTQKPAQ